MPDTLLGSLRLMAVMQTLQDSRNLPPRVRWVGRVPEMQATDDEITAYVLDQVLAADIVMDDQAAVTYQTGQINFLSHALPNLKLGEHMSQAMIRLYRKLAAQASPVLNQGDGVGFLNREVRILDKLRTGIIHRKEQLIVGMLTDTFTYNRLGVQITGSWGMPSDLKVTPSTPWTNAGAATPVSDIQLVCRIAEVRYSTIYNRLTMSRAAFDLMIATTEFQNKAKPFLATGIGFTNLDTNNTDNMIALAERTIGIPGMTIELQDTRMKEQDSAGAISATNFLPLNLVVLTDSANDGDESTWDFAQGEVIEALVLDLLQSQGPGALGATAVYGPFPYVIGNATANPPNWIYWCVDRGWPRKKNRAASAVLNIGTVVDPIDPTDPPFA